MTNTLLDNHRLEPETPKSRLWMPEQVLFTPAALAEPWGQKIKQ